MEEIYAFILATLLIYNNSLVVLGPTAWGTGLGPRRSYAVAVAGQLLGVATSTMRPIHMGTAEFLYISFLYVAISAAKISLPISVAGYAISSLSPGAAAIWLTSPATSAATYALCRTRSIAKLAAPSLLLVMYMFGYNNVALFNLNPALTAAAVLIGTYLGLGYSRWVVDIAALRPRTAASINLTASLGALLGTLANVPISFTLVAYSSMLVSAYTSNVRIIRARKFVKAYAGILIALLAASIFPYLKSLPLPHL
ncbi:hypothetical protein [Pyrobaculum neutrophilum]|uniref:Uncharacterized protein n=1 Tax=Pyrobaculum neutrophilum (strain DSM 2338 / JCM 9278 / NBRC 100436 / V24Sta) TaxID=444157 RepID=B1YA00_PYRNV|nr:hypothetical protein [Pyrobaculum neutrophilum]ACB40550.1 conserved hypothetical protein [Pyrobaculum neutrophilum V24Sta]